jgi:SAM-dependent methyltransferase
MPTLALPPDFPLQNFVTSVSLNDGLYVSSEHYVAVGLSAMKIFEYAITEAFTRPDGLRNILDLPCGYGRVARVLKSQFPDADLTVCDIDTDGVDFCIEHFSARGVYSVTDFDKLDLGQSVDLIWVGSLITHLNSYNTVKFIRCMERHLSQDGVLIISNHGKYIAEHAATTGYPSNWVIFQYNVIGHGSDADAHVKGYGTSCISRHWLEGLFAGEPCGIVAYLEQGWDHNHDVAFIKKRPLLPIEFDAERYLKLNQDVAEAGADPVQHYLMFGRKEGRRLW